MPTAQITACSFNIRIQLMEMQQIRISSIKLTIFIYKINDTLKVLYGISKYFFNFKDLQKIINNNYNLNVNINLALYLFCFEF